MAEFGVGTFMLPNAVVCTEKEAVCSKGDASLALSGLPLFRRGGFAAGAGLDDGPHVEQQLTQERLPRRSAEPHAPLLRHGGDSRAILSADPRTRGEAWARRDRRTRRSSTDTFIVACEVSAMRAVRRAARGDHSDRRLHTCGLGGGPGLHDRPELECSAFEARGSFWFLPETPASDPRRGSLPR